MVIGKVQFKEWKCDVVIGKYGNNRIALSLIDSDDGEPVATATSNLPEADLRKNEMFIKSYSENKGIIQSLLKGHIIDLTPRSYDNGFETFPICKLSKSVLTIIKNK